MASCKSNQTAGGAKGKQQPALRVDIVEILNAIVDGKIPESQDLLD